MSAYAVANSGELRMNVTYSISSQPIALVVPNPITRPASAHASSR